MRLRTVLWILHVAFFSSLLALQAGAASVDVSNSFLVNRERPYYDYTNQHTRTRLTVANISSTSFPLPVKLVITSVVPSQVTVFVPDGYTDDDMPFFYSSPLIGDVNFDGQVNGLDQTIVLASYGQENCLSCAGDVDGDGDVDGNDLALFASALGSSDVGFGPGETGVGRMLRFVNPEQLQFDFTVQILSEEEEPVNEPPVLVPLADQVVDEEGALSIAVSATDSDNDPLTLSVEPTLSFLQFTDHGDGSGTLLLKPRFADSGSYQITCTAFDSNNPPVSSTFTLTVTHVNRPPVLSPVAVQQVAEGALLVFQLEASDPDLDPLIFGGSNFPPGAEITEAGAFSWTPFFDQSGSHHLFVTVSDSVETVEIAVQIDVIDVNRPPSLITSDIGPGRISLRYSDKITATDPDGDTLLYTLLDGPAGMTIDTASGILNWLPSLADIGEFGVHVQVSDGRGGSDARLYLLSVPDSIPPSVSLHAPVQAIPGSSFTVTAQAADNDQVSSVTLEGDFGSEQFFSKPYERFIQLPDLAQVGTAVTFTAIAVDPSGNTAEATALVNIVGSPDITSPQVTLHAPTQAGQGQTILLTATAYDDVGVATVTFSTGDGTFIGSTPGDNAQVSFTIATDAPLDSVLQFEVVAEDFSGHSAADQAATLVVGEPDLIPPDPTVEVPDEVEEDEPLIVVVQTDDDTCLVEIYINHILAAVYTGPQNGSLSVPLPPGVESNMEVPVEVVITDCATNTTRQEDMVTILATGQGLITGEVYNDRTGLPLDHAELRFIMAGGEVVTGQTDQAGRFSLVADSGTGNLTVSAAGFTTVTRPAVLVPDNAGIEVFDARLTPISTPQPTASAVLGSVLRTPFSLVAAGFIPVLEDKGEDPASVVAADIVLDIPAGSCSADHDFTMTQISAQGLKGLLPGGWSPLAAVDIGPSAVSFLNGATLSIPNSLEISDAQVVVLSSWDESSNGWRLVAAATLSQDGSRIGGEISASGQYAFLLADLVPQQPATVQPGELLAGVIPALVPEAAITSISPQPQIIFYRPGVYSDVGLNVSTGSPDLSSGTPLLAAISEQYDFYDSSRMTPAAYEQDIVGYSWNRTALTALWPVTPFMEFEALALRQGTINVDVLAPVDPGRQVSVIGSEGGTVSTTAGAVLSLPAGSVAGLVPLRLNSLIAEELTLEIPVDFDFLGGVSLAAADTVFGLPAQLTIPLPADFVDEGQIVLVSLQEVQGATRFVLVGLGQVQDETIVSLYELPGGNNRKLPGITSEGRYLFLQIVSPTGFAAGRIYDTSAVPLSGALITAESLPLVSLSVADGSYSALVPVGQFVLSGLDIQTMDEGLVPGTILAAGDLVLLDITLQQEPPRVVSVDPQNGAENVALAAAIIIHFSEPLDPATVIPDNVTLIGPQGQLAGTISLSSGDTVLTFRPVESLLPDSVYVFTISQGIQDLAGHSLNAAFTMGFTSLDTLPPPMPPAGNITATIPGDTGQTTITATQGTAGPHDTVTIINKTKDTSTPVLVNADGSFSVNIDADIIDEVVISITDPAGNEIVVSVGRFENPDGSMVIGPEGGEVEADNGVILDVPPGAFPNGAIVKVTGLGEDDFSTRIGPDFPYVAGFQLECSVEPEIYMNASFPLPAGTEPDITGVVAQEVDAYGQKAMAIVDTARVIDGRLATSSPPCFGIMSKFARYSAYLNEHEQMRLGAAILSMGTPPVTRRRTTFQVYWERVPTYAFFGFGWPMYTTGEEVYWTVYDFISMIPTDGVVAALTTAELGYEDQIKAGLPRTNCLPVPQNRRLKVIVRDAETGDVVQDIEVDTPSAGGSLDISDLFIDPEDDISPEITWTSWNPEPTQVVSADQPFFLLFSEPVTLSGETPIYLFNEEKNLKIHGTVNLYQNNRAVAFIPDQSLPLGMEFQLVIEGIADFSGNLYVDPPEGPFVFTSFEPVQLSRLDKEQAAHDLGLAPGAMWGFGLQDLAFASKSPEESADGKWHTDLFAIRRGESSGDQLFIIDASDSLAPRVTSGLESDYRLDPQQVQLAEDIYLEPRQSDYADPQFWRNRIFHYVEEDPSIRICGDTNSNEVIAWYNLHCLGENTCLQKNGGCGDLLVTTAYSTQHSYLWGHDVTDLNDPKWVSARMLSDNGAAYGLGSNPEAPGGLGFAKGLFLLENIDITHQLNDVYLTNEETTGVYVAVSKIGLELVDFGLNFPTINDVERSFDPADPQLVQIESLVLNAHLYYNDVNVLGGQVVAVAGDIGDGTGIRTLEIFPPDLWGEPTHPPVFLHHYPDRLTSVRNFLEFDQDGDTVKESHDFSFVSGHDGGLSVVEIPRDGTAPLYRAFIQTPQSTWTRHIEIDREQQIAYVGAGWQEEGGYASGILMVNVGLASLMKPYQDNDGNGWDDRIFGRIKVTGTAEIPTGYVQAFRLDTERGLIYTAIRSGDSFVGEDLGLAIIKYRFGLGSADISLRSSTIDLGQGSSESVSEDGMTALLYVDMVPGEGSELCLNLDVDITPDFPVTYSLTELPISGDPADTFLDLSGDKSTGILNPYFPKICVDIGQMDTLPVGSQLQIDLKDEFGSIIKRLQVVATPVFLEANNVTLTTVIDRINGEACPSQKYLSFTLSNDAAVTVKIDGAVVDQVEGDQTIHMEEIGLPAGTNRIALRRDMVPEPGEHVFEITAVFRQEDPRIENTVNGIIIHDIVINEFLPVGHSFIKGVDLSDGHLSIRREDLSVPGIGPFLEFRRSYGSVGHQSSGPMGAGWSHNYECSLVRDNCGKVTLMGGEGSGTKFSNPITGINELGESILTFTPQAGYHGSLIYQLASDEYDYFTRSLMRYHYSQHADGEQDSPYLLQYIEDPHGNRLTLIYDDLPPYLLKTVTDSSGRTLDFLYRKEGAVPEERVVQLTGPLGLSVLFEYDQFGNLIRAARDEQIERYEYSADQPGDRHNLYRIIDPNGNITAYDYYDAADVVLGHPVDFDWQTDVMLLPHKNELVRRVYEGFAADEQATTEFVYDYSTNQTQLLTTVIDGQGNSALYTMNTRGGVVQVASSSGEDDNITSYRWAHDEGIDDVYMTRLIDANGRITSWSYDERGNKTSEVVDLASIDYLPAKNRDGQEAVSASVTYTYEPTFNKLTAVVDAEGNSKKFEISAETGDLLSLTTYPGNGKDPIIKSFTYHANGRMQTSVDANGFETSWAYDAYGNPVRIEGPNGYLKENIFDVRGRLLESTDSLGRHEMYEYDQFDRVVNYISYSGNDSADESTVFEYMANGLTKSKTDGLGHRTEYVYDALNRLILIRESLKDADGNEIVAQTSYGWDANDNKTHETDSRGVTYEYAFDFLNRVSGIVVRGPFGPEQTFRSFTYDGAGNRLSQTDLQGHTINYEYDSLYRVVETVLPLAPYKLLTEYDLVGSRLSQTDANGHTSTFVYDDVDRMTSRVNPLGHLVSYEYDPSGNLIEEKHHTTGLTVSAAGFDGFQRPATEIYEFVNPLSDVPISYTTTYAYNDVLHQMTVTSPRGVQTVETYNGNDKLVEKVVDPNGLNLVALYRYDANGNNVNMIDPVGNEMIYSYDGLGRMIKIDYPLNYEEKLFYDGDGNLVRYVDRLGMEFSSTYDNLNRKLTDRLLETISNGGASLLLQESIYLDQESALERFDANRHKTRHVYDALQREVRRVDPLGQTFTALWDGVNKIAAVDKRGLRTDYSYDPLNRLSSIEEFQADGSLAATTSYEYSDQENIVLETDARGIVSEQQLDPLQRVIRTRRIHPQLATEYGAEEVILESYEYDADSNLATITDANNNRTLQFYDLAGRKVRVVEGAGSDVEAATTFTYDNANNLVQVKDGRQHGGSFDYRYSYDALSRRTLVENGEGGMSLFAYDGNDNVVSFTDPRENSTFYSYDELNRLLSVDESRGGVGGITRFAFDANRNMLASQDANGNLVSYFYDGLNRRTDLYQHRLPGALTDQNLRGNDPLGTTMVLGGDLQTALHWSYDYDANSNPIGETDAMGQLFQKSYDFRDRLVQVVYANHQPPLDESGAVFPNIQQMQFVYDATGNLLSVAENKQIALGETVTENHINEYDHLDRQTSSSNFDGQVLTFTYDRNGNKISHQHAGADPITYGYNARNFLDRVCIDPPDCIRITSYSYYPDGLKEQVNRSNGTVTDFEYDRADRSILVYDYHGGDLVAEQLYSYDVNGNRLSMQERYAAINNGIPAISSYTYDEANRLTKVVYPNGAEINYTHALNGNRLTEEGLSLADPAVSVDWTYSYNNFNQLLEVRNTIGNHLISYTYDANGNTISRSTGGIIERFAYDIRNLLTRYGADGGQAVSFDYDYQNRRIRKRAGLDETRFLYEDDALFAEYDEFNILRRYLYGEELLSMVDFEQGGEHLFYHHDGLGSVTSLTDESGNVRTSYQYDVWGGIRNQSGVSNNSQNFLGHYFDSESELYNFGARYYDSRIGRFINQDPYIGDSSVPSSLHRYLYAYGNPFYYKDLNGYESVESQDEPGVVGRVVKTVASELGVTEAAKELGDSGHAGLLVLANELTGRRHSRAILGQFSPKSGLGQSAAAGASRSELLLDKAAGFAEGLNPIARMERIGSNLGESWEAIKEEDWGRAAEAMTKVVIAAEGYRKPAARVGKGVSRVYATGKIMSRQRVSKRRVSRSSPLSLKEQKFRTQHQGGQFTAPMKFIQKSGNQFVYEVKGHITLGDAYALAGSAFKGGRGLKGAYAVGGFTKPSLGNLYSNMKASLQGKKSLGRGRNVEKMPGAMAFEGDIDWGLMIKGRGVMTNARMAQQMNRQMRSDMLDTNSTHGVLGEHMPSALIPKKILDTNFKGGKPVDAFSYQKYGVAVEGRSGRWAPIVKPGGKETYWRKPEPNAFKINNWWRFVEPRQGAMKHYIGTASRNPDQEWSQQ